MRCISLWQPWASFWAWGIKVHETRDWYTGYRGELLIHAAKRRPSVEDLMYYAGAFQAVGKRPEDLVYGAIIGQGNLVACQRAEEVRYGTTQWDVYLGNYGPGRYAWRLEDVQAFEHPVPYKGQQGFFDVPIEEIEGAVRSGRDLRVQRGLFDEVGR